MRLKHAADAAVVYPGGFQQSGQPHKVWSQMGTDWRGVAEETSAGSSEAGAVGQTDRQAELTPAIGRSTMQP